MYKTLGFKWLNQSFCPASAFVSADRNVAPNPQRFIHVAVGGNNKKLTMNALRKNRLIFFLILIHIFLGISNLITSNQLLNKSFDSQISSYVSLIIYGVFGYFLLLRKNWMRVIFIALFFISLPLSILSLRPNILFLNNLIQLGLSTYIVILLFQKDIKALYTEKKYKQQKPDNKNVGGKFAKGDLITNIKTITDLNTSYITDMECVDDVNEYKDVISNILKLANIVDVETNAFEGEQRMIMLKVNNINHSFFLSGNNDYIDSFGLVKGLNEFLTKINIPGKIYWFWNCDWGQEAGFLYTDKIEKMDELLYYKNKYQEFGQISDGLKTNEPVEESNISETIVTPFDNISIKEILLLLAGVVLFQIGAADFILKTNLLSIGAISGLISGIFLGSGIYIIRRTLIKNYYRQHGI